MSTPEHHGKPAATNHVGTEGARRLGTPTARTRLSGEVDPR